MKDAAIRSLGLAMVLLLALVACEKSREAPPDAIIKIGVIYPLSGANAATGEDLKAGTELAAEIIDQSFDLPIPLAKSAGLSGNGATIRIVYRDSRGNSDQVADLVKELVEKEGVAAIIGCYSSTVTAAASEQAEILKIPFLNPASTSPTLTRRGLEWFFRTTPDDSMFVDNFFSFLNDLKQDGEAPPGELLIVYENRLWGVSVFMEERRQAAKHGFNIIADIPYDARQDRFDDELTILESSPRGVILQASYAKDAVLFMKGYKERRIDPVAILAMNGGFISPYFLKSLGRDGEYVLSREVWAPDLGKRKPLVKAVNDLFKERFGRDMTGHSSRAFTGLMVLADALNRAGSSDAEKVRAALRGTDIPGDRLIMPWDGVRFDPESGQNILGGGIIVQVHNGVYRTVWPLALASKPVVWPMPRWSERETPEERPEERLEERPEEGPEGGNAE